MTGFFKASGQVSGSLSYGLGLWLAWSSTALADVQDEILQKMRPGTGIEPERSDPWFLLSAFLVVLGVILVAGTVGAGLAWRMRRREMPENNDIRQSALCEVDRLRQLVALGEFDARQFATELSAVVRTFLERSLRLAATRQTTPEFLDGLRRSKALSDPHQRLLQDFLEQCDLAKFAQVPLTKEQLDRLGEAARNLIREVTPTTRAQKNGEAGL